MQLSAHYAQPPAPCPIISRLQVLPDVSQVMRRPAGPGYMHMHAGEAVTDRCIGCFVYCNTDMHACCGIGGASNWLVQFLCMGLGGLPQPRHCNPTPEADATCVCHLGSVSNLSSGEGPHLQPTTALTGQSQGPGNSCNSPVDVASGTAVSGRVSCAFALVQVQGQRHRGFWSLQSAIQRTVLANDQQQAECDVT